MSGFGSPQARFTCRSQEDPGALSLCGGRRTKVRHVHTLAENQAQLSPLNRSRGLQLVKLKLQGCDRCLTARCVLTCFLASIM